MLAARYRFSPRRVPGFFRQAKRYQYPGFAVLVVDSVSSTDQFAVSVSAKRGTTSVKRHAIRRQVLARLQKLVEQKMLGEVTTADQHHYFLILIYNWQKAQSALATLNL